MIEWSALEIRVHWDDLARRLNEFGPINKIKDPDARTCAKLMEQFLWLAVRNMDVLRPDERYQQRMVKAAGAAHERLIEQLQVVPALELLKGHRVGGKKGADTMRTDADERHKLLDTAIRDCLERKEDPLGHISDWVVEYSTKRHTVRRRIDKQTK